MLELKGAIRGELSHVLDEFCISCFYREVDINIVLYSEVGKHLKKSIKKYFCMVFMGFAGVKETTNNESRD